MRGSTLAWLATSACLAALGVLLGVATDGGYAFGPIGAAAAAISVAMYRWRQDRHR